MELNVGVSGRLLVTSVQSQGLYVQIGGICDVSKARAMQLFCEDYTKKGVAPNLSQLQIGMFCLAKLNGGQYARASIKQLNPLSDHVEVYFKDFGQVQVLHINQLLIANFSPHFVNEFPLYSIFYLFGVCKLWQDSHIQEICAEILNQEVDFYVKMVIRKYYFICISWKQFNFADYLIQQKKMGAPITEDVIHTNFSQAITNGNIPYVSQPQNNNILTNNNNFQKTNISPRQPRPLHAITMRMGTATYKEQFKSIIQETQRHNANIPYTGHANSSYVPKDVRNYNLNPNMLIKKPVSGNGIGTGITTYISSTLMVNFEYDVVCCFVENGPSLFCIQLKSSENDLKLMMEEIEKVALQPIEDKISLGMACIARYSEDNQLYRGLITNTKQTACNIAYIDYGNTELVPYYNLYQIPHNFLQHKTFAIKFSLSGYKELENLDMEKVKKIFKDLVLYKNLKLKVMPLEGPPVVQYCELYLNGENVLELLKRQTNKKFKYNDSDPLLSNEQVLIRFIHSPKKFFVQKLNSVQIFERMMDDLNNYCKKSYHPLSNPEKGIACAVMYENDWYRAEILGSHLDKINVRHVDFGYEHITTLNNLCAITEQYSKLSRQAIECCLKGFEDANDIKESAITQFEMMAERSNGEREEFTVKVYRNHQNGSYLVNLQTGELDVMKKLYKLGLPFNKYISLEKTDFATPGMLNSTRNEEDRDQRGSSRSSSTDSRKNQKQQLNRQSQLVASRPIRDPITANSRGNFEGRDSSRSSSVMSDQHNITPPKISQKKYEKTPYQPKTAPAPKDHIEKVNGNRNYHHNRSNTSFESNNSGSTSLNTSEDWNGKKKVPRIEEYVSFETEFPREIIKVPACEDVLICWWISPHQFFIHIKSRVPKFQKMMRELQNFYKNKNQTSKPLKVGSNVIALNRKDNIFYRAKITACNLMLRKFKVLFVDFGNQMTVSDQDIWEVERRFTENTTMAHMCSFSGIISNYDHIYITKQVEKYLMKTPNMSCKYLERENDLYFVEIITNGRSLKDLLESDGLVTKVGSEIRLEYLTGHQVRGTISSIKDMLNFKIEIEGCNVKLLCSYDDIKYVKSNPNLNEKFRKYYEGKSFILDISRVTGDKIIMARPLPPLFLQDEPSFICRYPVINNEFDVRVVHVEEPHHIFVHLPNEEHKVTKLLDDMFNYYETKGTNLDKYEVGTVCAVNSEDGCWYRARIMDIKKTNQIEVMYFDYGNRELISNENKTKIKRIENEFSLTTSALGIELYLPIKTTDTNTVTVIKNEIKSLTGNYVLKAKILDYFENRLIADLITDNYGVVEVLKGKGLITGPDMEFVQKKLLKEPLYLYEYIETVDLTKDEDDIVVIDLVSPTLSTPMSSLIDNTQKLTILQDVHIPPATTEKVETKAIAKNNNLIDAFLSHCDSPGKFFVQLSSDSNELNKLQENLQIISSSLPPLMRVVKGANCICLYSVDQQWYRAKIIDSELLVVQFTDYGNTDALSEATDIKEMCVPDRKSFCFECSLCVKPKGTIDWTDEANKLFNESYDKPVNFEYVTKGDSRSFINLFIDGENVADKLIAQGLAQPMELLKSGENCFVSHVNTLADFYIQMERDSSGMELMEDHLSGFESFPKITDNYSQGMICAALFPDDQMWYRAKVLSKVDDKSAGDGSSGGYKVLFIDYGNTTITSEIREISKEISVLPPLSKKCCLRLPENVLNWSEEAEEKFSEIAALGETVFVVELKEPGEHAMIDLFVDGRNVLEDLEPLCEHDIVNDHDIMNSSVCTSMHISIHEPDHTKPLEVLVSHINAPYDFYVQFNADITKIDDMTTSLNELTMNRLDNPILGTYCAGNYEGTFYRALVARKLNDGYHVVFVDFGNECTIPECYEMPDDLKHIQAFAQNCSLENSQAFKNNPKAVEFFNEMMLTIENIEIEIVDKDCQPWIVKAYANGESLCEKLNTMLGVKPDSTLSSVIISHAESYDDFYIQNDENVKKAEEILSILNENDGSNLEDFPNPKENDLVAAYVEEDTCFYRARIVKPMTEEGKFTVFFVDYGNFNTTSQIKKLPDSLHSLPLCCQKCSLESIVDQSASKHFSSVMEANWGEIFKVEVIETKVDTMIVNLFCKGLNIFEEVMKLIRNTEILPQKDQGLVDFFKKCTIIHTNSPNDFYIQFNEDSKSVEKITEILSNSDTFAKFSESPKVNDLCIARYLDDGAFYRAKILAVNDTEFEVLFVDFGNTSITNDIRKIPENEELLQIDSLTKHCALENLSDVDFWSEKAIELFSDIVNSHFNETFQVKILRITTDPWIVQLYFNEENLVEKLIQSITSQNDNVGQKMVRQIIKDSENIGGIIQEITEMDSQQSLLLHTKDMDNEIIEGVEMNRSSGLGSFEEEE